MRARRFLVSLSASIGILTAAVPSWATTPSALAQAATARARGEFYTAQHLLQALTRKDPRNLAGWLALGDLDDYLSEYQASYEDYRHAEALAPASLEVQAGLLQEINNLGQYDRAYELANRLLKEDTQAAPWVRSKIYLGLAASQGFKAEHDGLWAMLKYGFAVKGSIQRALDADPRYGDAHYAMGRYYLEAPAAIGGDVHQALDDFHRAYVLDPADYSNRAYYIRTLLDTHQTAVAREEYQRYQALFADIPAAESLVKGISARLQ